jgi:hypothetical protein
VYRFVRRRRYRFCSHHNCASAFPRKTTFFNRRFRVENFFAKLKALLRKAAERHFDALVDRIKIILQSVTIEECANYFIAAGYVKE